MTSLAHAQLLQISAKTGEKSIYEGSVEILRDADGELVSCEWTMRMFPSSE